MIGPTLKYAIGVDLGGTKIEMGIVDEKGQVHTSLRLETRTDQGAQAIQDRILEKIAFFRKSPFPIVGIGIGVAGQIHPQTGEVIFGPNLKWHHVPLQERIERDGGLPVRVLNDVRAITWAEWKYGAGQGSEDFICLFVGTGIGSGIVSGGHLLTGISNTAGEVGHMTVDFNGPLCTCGNRGCLEAFAGGWGIAARTLEAIKNVNSQNTLKLSDVKEELTAKKVVEAYREGDLLASQVIEQAERALIAGCVSLVNAFNPRRLILGGGLIEGLPEWVERVKQGIQRHALKAASQSLEVKKACLGDKVGIIGSAAFALHSLKN